MYEMYFSSNMETFLYFPGSESIFSSKLNDLLTGHLASSLNLPTAPKDGVSTAPQTAQPAFQQAQQNMMFDVNMTRFLILAKHMELNLNPYLTPQQKCWNWLGFCSQLITPKK
jgi:hypothetical protein